MDTVPSYSVDKGPLKKWTEHSNWPITMWSFWGKRLYAPYLLGGQMGSSTMCHFVTFNFMECSVHLSRGPWVDRCLESSIILWIPNINLDIFVQTLVQFGKIWIWCRAFISQFISEIKFGYNHQIKKSWQKV